MSEKNKIDTELVLEADARLHEKIKEEIGVEDPEATKAEEIISGATIGRRTCGCRGKGC